ncbi:MAG: hypothetical protein U5O16_03355 [Rhodococcus sp. (in: high G+C Gram-positive bacteria)]|uniref:hypothetical protein n=1 Tax=Rhodococcus sp. TaxID=1831 RepID=UPI002AD8CA7F|nr:hypothetical protein [Rhodococcus sp. (in: high G+C Gram-positive bacteria)]
MGRTDLNFNDKVQLRSEGQRVLVIDWTGEANIANTGLDHRRADSACNAPDHSGTADE